MTSFSSKVVIGGRVNIPKKIREKLKIEVGDYVKVEGITKLKLVAAENGI